MLCRGSSLLVIVGDVYVLSQNSYWRSVINYCGENYLGEEMNKEYIEKRKMKDDPEENNNQQNSNNNNFNLQPKSYKLLAENLSSSVSSSGNTSVGSNFTSGNTSGTSSGSSGLLGVNLHHPSHHIFSPNTSNILRDNIFNSNSSSNPSLSLSVTPNNTSSISPPPSSSSSSNVLRNSNDNITGLNTSNPKLDLSLSLPTMSLSNTLTNPKLNDQSNKKIDSPIYNNPSFNTSLYAPPFFSHAISRNTMFSSTPGSSTTSSTTSSSTSTSTSTFLNNISSSNLLLDHELVYSFQKFPLIFFQRNFGCPPISVTHHEVSKLLEVKISSFMSNSNISLDKQNNSISIQFTLKPNSQNSQIVVSSLGKSEFSKLVLTPDPSVFDFKLIEIFKSENFILVHIPLIQKISF